MKRDSKGRIIASLTEVKNKTGDIFALVDQYSAVYLTSYNKVRYKIEKISIENLLNDEHGDLLNNVSSKFENSNVVVSSKEKNNDQSFSDLKLTNTVDILDIDMSLEYDFVKQSIKPLV
jgi:hypothetical protein